MSGDRGVDGLVERMWEALAREQSFEGALDGFVRVARDAMPARVDAGLTLGDGGRPHTPAFTSERVAAVDKVQYEAGGGPCLEACRTRQRTELSSTVDETRWVPFCAACRERGIGSVLSVPLVARGDTLGSLNFYASTAHAFDPTARTVADDLGVQVAVLLDHAVTYWSARARAAGLDPATAHGSIDVGVAPHGDWQVSLRGEFDEPEASALRETVIGLVRRSDREIRLDMWGVEYMGSAGLAALLDAWEVATSAGLRLVITNPSVPVERLLDIAGMNALVVVAPR